MNNSNNSTPSNNLNVLNNYNILTIDVEDYYQVENFKKIIKFCDWEKYESRIARNTEKILEILSQADTKATFFVVGWIAEKFPELVKKIYAAGHEIGSHSYAHSLIYQQTKEEFREDLRKTKRILENIIQEPICGFRAPTYSINKESTWALSILMEEGFIYDASLFPFRYGKGGLPQTRRYPHKIYHHNNQLLEFPFSTINFLNLSLPFSGGGYLRLCPYGIVKRAIEKINADGFPAIIYMHPWEFDPEQPRFKVSYAKKFRHYYNLKGTADKLRRLLGDFEFTTVRNYINLSQGYHTTPSPVTCGTAALSVAKG